MPVAAKRLVEGRLRREPPPHGCHACFHRGRVWVAWREPVHLVEDQRTVDEL
jgi:hypothetical protein